MTKGIVISCIIAVLCFVQEGIAADLDNAADHDALRALRDKVEQSINAGDMQGLSNYLAKDFTFITSDQTVITDRAGIVKYWDSMFKSEKSPIISMTTKFNADILTQFLSPEIGYCRGTSSDTYTLRNKRKIAITSRWSVVLVKEQNAWKISTAHVGVNFLDNPVLAARDMSWFGRLCVALHLRKMPGELEG